MKGKLRRFFNGSSSFGGIAYALLSLLLVLAICILFVAQTYPLPSETIDFLHQIEIGITLLFAVDYLLRWWTHSFSIRYLFTWKALIDLLSILPLFFVGSSWQFVRLLRLTRLLRLLRLLEPSHSPLSLREYHLRLVRIIFTLFCLVFISAGLIYPIEHEKNPEEFRTFFDAVYFTVVTTTTVGFGDLAPLDWKGRLITLVMILTGAIMIPWQVSDLVRHLIEHGGKRDIKCTVCSLTLHEGDATYCKKCGGILNNTLNNL